MLIHNVRLEAWGGCTRLLGCNQVEQRVLRLSIVVIRGLISLFFDETSEVVGDRCVLMGNLVPLLLHERQFFGWNLGLFLSEKLALAL